MLIQVVDNVETKEDKKIIYQAVYDENNNLLVEHDDNDGFYEYWFFFYDDEGRLVEKYSNSRWDNFDSLVTNGLPDNYFLTRRQSTGRAYVYDEGGHLEAEVELGGYDGLESMFECGWSEVGIAKARYTYDEEGHLVQELKGEMIYHSKNGQFVWMEEDNEIDEAYRYEYDKDGNLIAKMILNHNDLNLVEEKTTYDKNGNELKHEKYLESGAVSEWTDYIYDAEGNLQEVCTYSAMGTLQERIAYEYTKVEAGVTVDDIIHNSNLDVSTEQKREEIISRLTDMIMSEYEKNLVFDWLSEIEMTPDEIAIYSQQINRWDSDL